jgi:hypothetical protein
MFDKLKTFVETNPDVVKKIAVVSGIAAGGILLAVILKNQDAFDFAELASDLAEEAEKVE